MDDTERQILNAKIAQVVWDKDDVRIERTRDPDGNLIDVRTYRDRPFGEKGIQDYSGDQELAELSLERALDWFKHEGMSPPKAHIQSKETDEGRVWVAHAGYPKVTASRMSTALATLALRIKEQHQDKDAS